MHNRYLQLHLSSTKEIPEFTQRRIQEMRQDERWAKQKKSASIGTWKCNFPPCVTTDEHEGS